VRPGSGFGSPGTAFGRKNQSSADPDRVSVSPDRWAGGRKNQSSADPDRVSVSFDQRAAEKIEGRSTPITFRPRKFGAEPKKLGPFPRRSDLFQAGSLSVFTCTQGGRKNRSPVEPNRIPVSPARSRALEIGGRSVRIAFRLRPIEGRPIESGFGQSRSRLGLTCL
jgi:hypothetical protein